MTACQFGCTAQLSWNRPLKLSIAVDVWIGNARQREAGGLPRIGRWLAGARIDRHSFKVGRHQGRQLVRIYVVIKPVTPQRDGEFWIFTGGAWYPDTLE